MHKYVLHKDQDIPGEVVWENKDSCYIVLINDGTGMYVSNNEVTLVNEDEIKINFPEYLI